MLNKINIFVPDLTLQIFEGDSTKLLSQSEAQPSKMTSISFDRNGHQVAIGLDEGTVKVLKITLLFLLYSQYIVRLILNSFLLLISPDLLYRF